MKRLAYICSMPHSGSTAFSLFLGTHSRIVGLGGIDRAVETLAESLGAQDSGKKAKNLPCTCGAMATSCPYWGEVAKRLGPGNRPDRKERYAIALEAFKSVYGDEMWPVDSSKHVEPLGDLCEMKNVELRAFHLIKDVRSLTTSFIDQTRKAKGNKRSGILLAFEYFLRWRRENGKIDTFLAQHQVQSRRIGYEELCLASETIMAAISKFLDLPAEPGSLLLNESRSHLIVGNRMRNQEEKQVLGYDHRWFARRDWLLASVLFPQIRRYNSKAVYSNESAALWAK